MHVPHPVVQTHPFAHLFLFIISPLSFTFDTVYAILPLPPIISSHIVLSANRAGLNPLIIMFPLMFPTKKIAFEAIPYISNIM